MSIRTSSTADMVMAERLATLDPFQLATPCWRVRQFLLPPEHRTISIQELTTHMAIRTVAEAQAPERLYKSGVVSSSKEWSEVISTLREAKPGQAFIVTLESEALLKEPKPETKFAYALRRYFESHNMQVTAYQSSKGEVTIRKATALDMSRKGRKKKIK